VTLTYCLLPFAFLRAIFNVLPIAGPLLAPFEFEVAALANLRREAVLDLCLHGMRLAGTASSEATSSGYFR
jgi:hypothetical protein